MNSRCIIQLNNIQKEIKDLKTKVDRPRAAENIEDHIKENVCAQEGHKFMPIFEADAFKGLYCSKCGSREKA